MQNLFSTDVINEVKALVLYESESAPIATNEEYSNGAFIFTLVHDDSIERFIASFDRVGYETQTPTIVNIDCERYQDSHYHSFNVTSFEVLPPKMTATQRKITKDFITTAGDTFIMFSDSTAYTFNDYIESYASEVLDITQIFTPLQLELIRVELFEALTDILQAEYDSGNYNVFELLEDLNGLYTSLQSEPMNDALHLSFYFMYEKYETIGQNL